ncbi:MAG: argininosuccinate synthase [Halanaerobiaceae bacterium]
METKDINKIVLAYSGGLDTSIAIKWLKEKYDAEIIAYSADVGQGGDWRAIEEKALKTGASKVYIDDLKEEFVEKYVFSSLKANALYEEKYPLATALSRPLIAEKMVEIAHEEDADAVAHGCTGKGNDQVRFDVTFRALDSELEIIAPLRVWDLDSRNEEMEYARKNDIPVEATKESPYSIDRNLWGLSIECGELENPWNEPPEDAYEWTRSPENAPEEPEYMTITFKKGIPVKVDGEEMEGVDLIQKINRKGALHGVGRIDMVENRLVGIKSREIYEAPAATILLEAHRHLEDLTLDRDTAHYKELITEKFSQLVYFGLWYSPLRRSLNAFIEETQKQVSGKIRVKLYKGQCTVVGRESSKSLYQYDLATYEAEDAFEHHAAPGFIKLWGLPTQIAGEVERRTADEE